MEHRLTLRLPKDLYSKIAKIADDSERSINSMVITLFKKIINGDCSHNTFISNECQEIHNLIHKEFNGDSQHIDTNGFVLSESDYGNQMSVNGVLLTYIEEDNTLILESSIDGSIVNIYPEMYINRRIDCSEYNYIEKIRNNIQLINFFHCLVRMYLELPLDTRGNFEDILIKSNWEFK